MFSKTNLFAAIIFLSGILSGSFGAVSAQDKKDDKKETITISKKEDSVLKKLEKAKTADEKMQLVEAYIKEFPQSAARQRVVEFAAREVLQLKDNNQIILQGEKYLQIFTPDAEADLVLPALIFSYIQVKRTKDAFDTAQKYLARHPEDISTPLMLSIEGSNQARTGNKDFAVLSGGYAAQAIELIQADKRPSDIAEANWQEYKTKWLPQLYQTQGYLEYVSGEKAKSRVSLEKATALNSADINSWLLLGSMLDDEYQALALKYNTTAAGAERDAQLVKANEKLDATIESFARIVALTDGKPEAKQINDQVRENLESYYKYRHKNTDGLKALIDKYKK
ncbi:MAG: hypothetical protein ABIP06_11350 [Pyrinomonadaceae bacterium]